MSDRNPTLEHEPTARAETRSVEPDLIQVRHDLPFSEAKKEAIRDFEVFYLRRLIAQTKGNVSRAARLAKMDRMYLHRLLIRHELGGRTADIAAGED